MKNELFRVIIIGTLGIFGYLLLFSQDTIITLSQREALQKVLGDINKESLYAIWNGEKYKKFRKTHFDNKTGDSCNMCTDHCDKKIIGDFFN